MDNKDIITKIKEIVFGTEEVVTEVKPEVVPEVTFETVNLEDGTPLYFDGELAVATEIFTDEAMTIPQGDGEFKLEDGTSITVTEGKVTSLIEAEVEEVTEDPPEEVPVVEAEETPKLKLSTITEVNKWDIEVDQENFNVGVKVTSTVDSVVYPIPGGEYFLEDGRAIQVDSDGVIVMITGSDEFNLVLQVRALEATVELLKNEKEDFASEKEAFELKVQNLESDIEKFNNEPAVKPITQEPQAKTEKTLLEKRLNALYTIKALRNKK